MIDRLTPIIFFGYLKLFPLVWSQASFKRKQNHVYIFNVDLLSTVPK